MKTLIIANRKGGVGKTLISTHAAWWFAERAMTILVIDLDTQGNTSKTLSETHQLGPAHLLFQEDAIVLDGVVDESINVLSASTALDTLKAKGPEIIPPFVSNMRAIAGQFDICIIDSSPDQNFVNLAGLISATHALAPLNMGSYALDGVELMLKTIIGIKTKHNENLEFIGLLPNMLIRNQPGQVNALRDLYTTYPEKYVFPASIAHRTSFEGTVNRKQPIWTDQRTSARLASDEMRSVMMEVEKRMDVTWAS